nr:glycosyl transferase [Actinomycetota bacterium]
LRRCRARPAGGRATGGRFGAGAGGGLLSGSIPGPAVTAALDANASSYTWTAAAVGSESASGYQLATGRAVMAIGGFNGTDPYPTLAAFEKDVAQGKVHYFIGGGRGGGGPGRSTRSDSSAISTWVEAHFAARTVGGVTLYDLTSPAGT